MPLTHNRSKLKESCEWIKFLTTLVLSSISAPSLLLYVSEKRKQRRLTQIPMIYRQITPFNDALCSLMTSVLLRSVRPSLFMLGSNYSKNPNSTTIARTTKSQLKLNTRTLPSLSKTNKASFHRECIILDRSFDKQRKVKNCIHMIVLDWYFPTSATVQHEDYSGSKGRENFPPIQHPVILLPSIIDTNPINIQNTLQESMIHTCLKNQWVVVTMEVKEMVNLDSYSSSFTVEKNLDENMTRETSDIRKETESIKKQKYQQGVNVNTNTNFIRSVTRKIYQRIQKETNTKPLFLIGNSVYSNDLILQYLGEEELSTNKKPSSIIAGAIIIESNHNDTVCYPENNITHTNLQQPGDYLSRDKYIPHISVPLLHLVTSNNANDENENRKVNMERTKQNGKNRTNHPNNSSGSLSSYLQTYSPHRYSYSSKINPNVITVNVKMGNHWQWNVSRKYGLSEFYWLLKHVILGGGANNNGKSMNRNSVHWVSKANWADRVSSQFIKAILQLKHTYYDDRGVNESYDDGHSNKKDDVFFASSKL